MTMAIRTGNILCLWVTSLVLFLSGCTSVTDNNSAQQRQMNMSPETLTQSMPDSGLRYRRDARDNTRQQSQNAGTMLYVTPNTLFHPRFTHKSLSDYAQQLAMQLMDSARNIRAESLIGVATFVELDSSLQNSSILGNQLSEMLIGKIQSYGMSVVDFKVTGNVSISQSGDFAFSRNTDNLAQRTGLDFVLSGTLIRTEKGVEVNARIVDLSNKVVVASGNLHIPHFIAAQLHPTYVIVD